MIEKNIPKTSNQAELSFSNTQAKELKTRFKTGKGIINYVKPIIERLNREKGNDINFDHYSYV
jgi:hypothetical protein